MDTKEHITHEAQDKDAWVCVCKNTPVAEGFYPCDKDGNQVEPVKGWTGLYVCDRCGRIIDQATLRVVGRRAMTETSTA